MKIEASSSKKSSYKKNRKTIRDDERIKRVIFNHEKAQEKYFLAILLDSPELFDSVKDIQDVYFSDLHYRSLFKLWKTTNEVVTLKDLDEDLKFIYEELSDYLKSGFVSDPDMSQDIELENVKTRLAIDYQKRKLNETEIRLKEEEELGGKDENIIGSLMNELVEITENIKNLERTEVN